MIILVVDDDIDDLQFFGDALAEIDTTIQCVTATNGIEALRQLDQFPARPDFIFLDLNMPCKNGLECLKEIKKMQKLKNIPIVMYSTSSNRSDVENAYKEGANLYVKKPNTYAEMKKIAHKVTALVQAMRSAHA